MHGSMFVSQVRSRCLHSVLSRDHAFGELFFCPSPANLVRSGGGFRDTDFFFFLGKPWSCDFNEATGGLDIALECCPLPTHSLYSPSEADLCPGKTHCWQLRPPVYSSLDGVESQQRFHSSFLKHMLFFIDLEDLCET